MSYTVIWFAKHKPDAQPGTLHIPAPIVWGGAVALVLLPFLAFFTGYSYMAPEALQYRLERQTLEFTDLEKAAQTLKEERSRLKKEAAALQQEVLAEVNKRAAAEAKVAIVETARTAALERVNTLETKVTDLQSQIDVFQDILQPSKETLPVQCYNVKAEETPDGLKYALSFLKTDNKDKSSLDLTLHARILTGENVVGLEEVAQLEGDVKKDITFSTTFTTTGSLKGQFLQKGVRVLDVRGYTTGVDNAKLKTHCWKVF